MNKYMASHLLKVIYFAESNYKPTKEEPNSDFKEKFESSCESEILYT